MAIHQQEVREAGEAENPPRYARGCGIVFLVLALAVSAIWGGALGLFVFILDDAQDTIEALDQFRPRIGSKVYSADGIMLGEFTDERIRALVPLNEMPLHLQKAFIATEDDKFFEHKGVRPDAIVNAALYIARTGRLRGGSTITQQLVRNVGATGVDTEQTIRRKIHEAIVALQLEREFTKDEILELYLNQIFLGISAYGVEAGAQQYFAKSCRDVTLSEAAMLAGVVRAPNKQEPFQYFDNAKTRRDIVLGQMLENGFITQAEYEAALAEDLAASVVTPEERAALAAQGKSVFAPNRFKAPYFVEEVRKFLLHDLGLSTEQVYGEGLEIHTTLNWRMQQAAERALLTALEDFDEKKRGQYEARGTLEDFIPVWGALVSLDNRDGMEGAVRALVGGRDFTTSKFNTATQARRQPGSSVKPFVWAAAIDSRKYTAASIVVDEPFVRIDPWGNRYAPKNFDGKHLGPITLRRALRSSVNIVSLKLVEDLGMPLVASYLERSGVANNIDPVVGLTIALGTPVTIPLDHCVAYSTFPNNGQRHPASFVNEIRDRDGFLMYEHARAKPVQALSPNTAYVVTTLLEEVCEIVTGWRTKDLARPRGGKTGTTNDSKDAWFCGFTPQFTTVTWMGYKDSRPLGQGKAYTGGALASPIWTEYMIAAHEGLPEQDFDEPEGVEYYAIDKSTGIAGGGFKEVFLAGTKPPKNWPRFMFEEEDLEAIGLDPLGEDDLLLGGAEPLLGPEPSRETAPQSR